MSMRQRDMRLIQQISVDTRASGFSLVELMLAMALGTIIVLGAVGLFVTNQRTFQLQQGMTNVQQQGGFTQGFLMNDLRQAAYQSPSVASTIPAGVMFKTTATPNVTANGQTIPLSSDGGANGASDRLTFSFDGTQDCEGSTVANATRIVETYYVANSNLYCHGSLTAGSGTVLLSGVPTFQVLYGMDTIEDQQPIVSSYVTANVASSVVDNLGNPAQVVAVRVAFIVQQDSGNPQNVSNGHTYMVLEQLLTDGTAPLTTPLRNGITVPQVRREFVATIPIRNFNWVQI